MKKTVALLPLLAVLPLSANTWEAGLFIGQQSYKSHTVSTLSVEADSKVAYGFRLGRSIVDLGPALITITAGFQPETKTTLKYSGAIAPAYQVGNVTASAPSVDYKTQHFSVGAMANFKAFVAVGAGIEYRFEKLEIEGTSTNYARPWVRVNAGIAIPSPVVKPFIGVEAAIPVTSKSLELSSSDEDFLKAMAPKFQIGVYAGIRF
ncbi:MAG TPA: hypothetical protein VK188_17270 [Holophaga sp.]|nr:hypothetical protein [Holophaga sp.]